MIKPIIYLTNLYKYTCGDLVYKELELPMDFTELTNVEKELIRCGGEELFISDSNFDIAPYADYKKYNEVFLYASENDQLEDALLLLKHNSCPNIEELRNILENHNYNIIDAANLEDLGRYVVEEDLIKNSSKIKEIMNLLQDSYIDFEAIGRDYEINNGLTKIKKRGYVEIYY